MDHWKVNKRKEKKKRKGYESIRKFLKVQVIKVDLDRRGFTKHCQHMNAKGKELMAKRISAAIKHTLMVCQKTPISMKWKEDISKENQGL